ncbi:MAG: hypothetical protein LKH74_09850 [Levilactobacillus sp.]|jgi:hypothetical protein|uniref:hypothetical protein n=1 Tax=Levilactobacillus sp. TaxID=2767919 RepID=UPI00258971B7|nr:hypothetical protein [Levilactobacillus sp.]MCH4123953.1 hypothetical protein [Levilactobacillus sp.]MCI1554211.1 hypothetical protein [Levilactobacillus sp.]MCI1598795.1 hypothetical protein [Levilactobacillus sp.]MCI1605434.1 hypothetical protein [Levilactobacillus sp.]
MKQLAINGTIASSPKVLKLNPLLIFAKVTDDAGQTHNCLIHQHGLNFLYQATVGARVALFGHANQRHQLVITQFTVIASSAATAS